MIKKLLFVCCFIFHLADLYSAQETDNMAAIIEEDADSTLSKSKLFSIRKWEEALSLYKMENNNEAVARVSGKLLVNYTIIENHDKALEHAFYLLAYYEDKNDSSKIVNVKSYLAGIHAGRNEYDLAIMHTLEAIKISELMNNQLAIAPLHNNLATFYLYLEKFPESILHLKKSYELSLEHQLTNLLIRNNFIFSDIHEQKEEYEMSKVYLYKAEKLVNKHGTQMDSVYLFKKKGINYYLLDSLDESQYWLKQGQLLAKEIGSLNIESRIAHWQCLLFKKKDNLTLALDFLEKKYSLLDSLRSQETVKKNEEYKVLYEMSKLEDSLKIEKLSSIHKDELILYQERKTWAIGLFSIILLIGTIIIAVQFRKKNKLHGVLLELNLQSVHEKQRENKYKHSNLSTENKEKILSDLTKLIHVDEIFLDKSLKLDSLCTTLKISRTYLSQVINESFSMSFNEYIKGLRIEKAKLYLIDDGFDKYSIKGVSELVGFNSLSSFNESFKKATGLTPSYFRKYGNSVQS